MKPALILLPLLFTVTVNCWHGIAGCETKDTQKKRDQCNFEVAALAALLVPRAAKSASPSAGPGLQTVNFTEESAYVSNDTFVTAQVLPLPSASTVQALSGRINTEGDVDIYSVSYTSGAALAFVLDVSKPGTAAVCSMYTSFGPSGSASSSPDGSLVHAGTISANVTALALDRVSHTHLYIRCSGLSNELYSIRLAYSALN